MPPNAFRWMRFCPETETLWWFVHNHGMPSAVPENAGLFEHFQMEVAAGSAITRPYVKEALKGVRAEAERYLTKAMIEEIKAVLGNNAVMDEMVKLGRLEQAARDRDAARNAPDGLTDPGRDHQGGGSPGRSTVWTEPTTAEEQAGGGWEASRVRVPSGTPKTWTTCSARRPARPRSGEGRRLGNPHASTWPTSPSSRSLRAPPDRGGSLARRSKPG